MNRNNKWVIGSFLLPAVILLIIFLIIPFFMAFGLSFTNSRLIGPRPTSFIGLLNFDKLLNDSLFWKGLKHNILYVAIVVPIQTSLALLLAILVNQKIKFNKLFRTIYFIPTVTAMVAVSVIWSFLYHPSGVINSFLKFISFGAFQGIDFLNNTTWAFPSIMIMSIWQGVGFQMLIFLAGLQDIPKVYYEAAEIDGAGTWEKFRHITLPQLKNTITFVVISTTILAFRLFTQIKVMTNGGPQHSTHTVMLHIFNMGYKRLNIGYGSAITVVFFLIILTISLLQRNFLGEQREVD